MYSFCTRFFLNAQIEINLVASKVKRFSIPLPDSTATKTAPIAFGALPFLLERLQSMPLQMHAIYGFVKKKDDRKSSFKICSQLKNKKKSIKNVLTRNIKLINQNVFKNQ